MHVMYIYIYVHMLNINLYMLSSSSHFGFHQWRTGLHHFWSQCLVSVDFMENPSIKGWFRGVLSHFRGNKNTSVPVYMQDHGVICRLLIWISCIFALPKKGGTRLLGPSFPNPRSMGCRPRWEDKTVRMSYKKDWMAYVFTRYISYLYTHTVHSHYILVSWEWMALHFLSTKPKNGICWKIL